MRLFTTGSISIRSNGSPQGDRFLLEYKSACERAEQQDRDWIKALRAAGIRASHPNDGWVNREKKQLVFSYPQFNDMAAIGDLVALGWSFEKTNLVVKLLSCDSGPTGMLLYWGYEVVGTWDNVKKELNMQETYESSFHKLCCWPSDKVSV